MDPLVPFVSLKSNSRFNHFVAVVSSGPTGLKGPLSLYHLLQLTLNSDKTQSLVAHSVAWWSSNARLLEDRLVMEVVLGSAPERGTLNPHTS